MVDAIARVAWIVGAQVKREVKGLSRGSAQRPNLQIVLPGQMLLTDVTMSHSMAVSNVVSGLSTATQRKTRKNTKYGLVAARVGAELLNLFIDTCRGMAGDAPKLVEGNR